MKEPIDEENERSIEIALKISRLFKEEHIDLKVILMAIARVSLGVFAQVDSDELIENYLVHLKKEYYKIMKELRAKP